MKSRQESLQLLEEWVKSDSLRKHCLGVAASAEAYAPKGQEDIYWTTGLLHDYDWEKYPDINLHPRKGCENLKSLDYPEEIITAILGHNATTGVPRDTHLAKTLFAVDELSGLIIALAKIRPGNFSGMKPKSVKKKLKDKCFAQAVNRQDVQQGIDELEVDMDLHIQKIIDALTMVKEELGFA